jgi:hypothetical protein
MAGFLENDLGIGELIEQELEQDLHNGANTITYVTSEWATQPKTHP